ncbi:hypothetical protein H6781_00685 [Candidatus Nomurabacteria bacterium]|nr:hypothetical protein [Candidatus Kaiserbacteria bacterium]MCB9810099.1 hypothetical protein [Candidatus Nomurabacteria bacterium]MCB9814981.1 hypothetical protein [Candidatus Nomurabacteria bacterium]
MSQKINKKKRYEVMFEFLLFGIVIGVTEDLIAVHLTTGETITWTMVGIVILLAIPFAIIGELIADHVDFVKVYERVMGKNK